MFCIYQFKKVISLIIIKIKQILKFDKFSQNTIDVLYCYRMCI